MQRGENRKQISRKKYAALHFASHSGEIRKDPIYFPCYGLFYH
jgi:hypothetical protein